MIVGITKEIKTGENRVSMTPFGVRELVRRGHRVLVEEAAGMGSGFSDEQFAAAGARLVASARQVGEEADMIVKVKGPVPDEYAHFREGLTLFTYLHLAADRSLTEHLLKEKVTGIAYETVELADGSLPLLRPMSEVAGRIGAQEAANLLASHRGGKGVLMGGIPGVSPARVVVLGGGASGLHAARVCLGLGAQVTIFDVDLERLRYLDQVLDGRCLTAYSTAEAVEGALASSDVVIGCVLVPGARAPHLITKDMLRFIEPGTVLVDIAIDQGGCFETSRPTNHQDPTFVLDGIVHYCVANIPSAMPRTSTQALSNATLPYVLKLADRGIGELTEREGPFRGGLNTFCGALTNERVAHAYGTGAGPEHSMTP